MIWVSFNISIVANLICNWQNAQITPNPPDIQDQDILHFEIFNQEHWLCFTQMKSLTSYLNTGPYFYSVFLFSICLTAQFLTLQMISTAALFLAAKSEETACPLNNVLRASCEILHNQDFDVLSYRFPVVSIHTTTMNNFFFLFLF